MLGVARVNSSVGERRSLDWTVRLSVTFGDGLLTYRSFTRDQHWTVSHVSMASVSLLRRCNDDWSKWWASATSQKYKSQDGLPLRKAAQLCSAQAGCPLRQPTFADLLQGDASSSVAKDDGMQDASSAFRTSSTPVSSLSWSLPPSPCPIYSHRVIFRRRSNVINVKQSSILCGEAAASPATSE